MSHSPLSARGVLIEKNRREYGDRYDCLYFPSEEAAGVAMARRSALLAELEGRTILGAGGTKLDCRNLSPGCRACMEGTWSCLFITGHCNGHCFYCPAPQDVGGVPGTNNLDFPDAGDFVDYLARFGFSGASISGGEPLLELERSLQFLHAVRDRFGDRVYLWLYTNGVLLTRETALRLRDAGLDELRFDIGATGYSLDAARLAVGIIGHVTVEIPAIPEEAARLPGKLDEMAGCGINHLNLHQLRLTRHNLRHLAGRGYTFLHGESVTVLESELLALELVRHGLERHPELGVNYCSFVYKNRFQAGAGRRRAAAQIVCKHEDITHAGYLRSLSLGGSRADVAREVGHLQGLDPDQLRWLPAADGSRVQLCASLCAGRVHPGLELRLQYSEARILPSVSYRNAFVEVALNPGRKVVVERQPVCEAWSLGAAQWLQLEVEMGQGSPSQAWQGFVPSAEQETPLQQDLRRFEHAPTGLQEYY